MSKYFTKTLYYSTRLLLIFSAILFLIQKDWPSAISTILILLLVLSPSLLKKKFNLFLPFELDLLIGIFIFITLFLGSLQNYYERFPLLDGIIHFKSGLLLGILSFIIIYTINISRRKIIILSPLFISIFAVSFSMSISVIWEIYEYFVDMYLGFNMQESGLQDTMGDLIVNTLGAIIVSIFGYIWMKKKHKIPFTPGKTD